jgi:4-hydroxy-tetrahydrodipicolinate synthase
MYEHIYGILPPVTTPFRPDNTIDEQTIRVQLWNAVQAGIHGQALALHEKLLPIWNAIHHDNLPANVKFCMELLGRPAGGPRPPMPPTSDAQAGPIRQALKNAGLL